MNDSISRRQAVAIGFVALLSPLIRRFPRALAEQIGRSAYLSVLFALVPLALMFLLYRWLFSGQNAGAGLAERFCLSFGKGLGRAVCILYALWFSFYAGFLLRSGADRFIITVFHGAQAWIFIISMLLLCLPAALGQLRYLGRSAMIFRPLMAAVLLLITVSGFLSIDLSPLLPVTASDLLPNAYGALETANVLAVAFYLTFLGGNIEGRFRCKDFLGWGICLLLILFLITSACIGMFGSTLTGRLTFPFFMLVRDVGALGSLERIEPMVIAIWVFSDFVIISLLLCLAGRLLGFGFGAESSDKPLRQRLTCAAAAASCVTALFCAKSLVAFRFLSEDLVPLLNAVFVFAIPLLCAVTGKLRGKL